MTSNLPKTVMMRSKLRNKFLKENSEISRTGYIKQRNYCVNLSRKTEK